MKPEQIQQGFKVRPINESILRKHIDNLIASQKEMAEYRTKHDAWFASAPDPTDLKALIAHKEVEPQEPRSPNPSTLSGMFHLDVGGGIRKYREMLVEDLAARGADGEKAWGDIALNTEMMENYLSTNSAKRYARTLEEAKALYGKKGAK